MKITLGLCAAALETVIHPHNITANTIRKECRNVCLMISVSVRAGKGLTYVRPIPAARQPSRVLRRDDAPPSRTPRGECKPATRELQ